MKEHSRKEIWKMFDTITSKYDFLNHFLSLGFDYKWRRALTRQIVFNDRMNILDLCSGTGDQIFSIINSKNFKSNALIGMDMSANMLSLAKDKLQNNNIDNIVNLVRGNGESIPLKKNIIDIVTVSFGIRNICDISKCLDEIYRVLTPSGKLLILEFSLPQNLIIRNLYIYVLRYFLPTVGGLFSKNKEAYIYLADTIRSFPSGDSFLNILQNVGFSNLKQKQMSFGTVTLYQCEK